MRIIKKYKNRKLYDSVSRRFVRLKDIFNMINNGETLKILNHLGEDVTFDVISKAKFNNSTCIQVDKRYFNQIINSIEKLLKGKVEDFSEVLFKLVDEKIIDGQYARTLGVSIISQMGTNHEFNEGDVIAFFKECGMITVEEYNKLKEENAVLTSNMEKISTREETVKLFWKCINDAEFDNLLEIINKDAKIFLPNTREVFKGVNKYIAFNKKYPGRWYAGLESLHSAGDEVISVVQVYDEAETMSFFVTSIFNFTGLEISEIKEYWGDNGEPPQWRVDEGLSERY